MGKKRYHYDPLKTLRPVHLSHNLESIARDLYNKACCGSRSVWDELFVDNKIVNNPETAKLFVSLANKGMRDAQNYIVDYIQKSPNLTDSEECLFRSIADSIAWQFIENQICYARRLYLGQNPPNLKYSNFQSVVSAANNIINEYPESVALISDLTTFVQIGDIYALIPGQGRIIYEVKEGDENKRLADFMHSFFLNPREKDMFKFLENNSEKSIKQFERMMRQASRMSHVSAVMADGSNTDPDTGKLVVIPDQPLIIDSWEEELCNLMDSPQGKGWGIHVVDECLFIGCYFDNGLNGGHILFNNWFDSSGATKNSPRSTLFDSMHLPLALPLFNKPISEEKIFDLLFGRLHVCMGICVERLVIQCEKEGLKVRAGSNRETSQLEQQGNMPYKHNGKALFIGNGEKEFPISPGIFTRILFHGQKPISLIKAILNSGVDEFAIDSDIDN